ncbi:WD40-repeat-containing domain protein [Armillaria novae-zelandiae]|uniref:WD40-repeat-containing domain protein n=1 Tax=Armillaria novae-zelandiae TaxID=153914 RepID=A0AA39TLP8_9AGAR|nr:WD40-repeat-containing domain protein [Armillaria novae-zelandiae]
MSTEYHIEKTIKSPQAAVLCLAATEKGQFLASRGADGVYLWNTKTGKQLRRPGGGGFRGDTTAMTWIRGEDDADEALIYGTLRGYLICWRQIKDTTDFEELYCLHIGSATKITALDFNPPSRRLVLSTRNGTIQVHQVDAHMSLHGHISVSIQNCDARAIYFLPNGESRNIMVFGCRSGKMYSTTPVAYLLRGNDGSVIESYDAGGIIGNATMNAAKDVFGIDDPSQGVALYRVLDGAKVKTLPVKATKTPRPRQVAFTQDSKIVVSGSDHGIIYMFERRDGSVSKLTTEGTAWVQTVTTANVDGISTIVAANSRDVGTEMSKIYIWKKQSQPLGAAEIIENDTLTLACKNWLIIGLLVALLTFNFSHMLSLVLCIWDLVDSFWRGMMLFT